jgi:lysophospholipase L1-like esterase
MFRVRLLFIGLTIFSLFASTLSPVSAAPLAGFATMGASETQGTGYSGSWVPYLANDRGLNFGPSQTYNRAVGGATTTSLLSGGQHTQVRDIVQAGNADVAFLFIGGNDFGPVVLQLATGTLNKNTWAAGMVSRMMTATDTVLTANPEGMIIAGLPDMTLMPAAQAYLPSVTPTMLQNVLDAINLVNTQLKSEVLARDLVFLDTAQAMRDMNAVPLVVGGVPIQTVGSSSNPTYFFQDGLHPAVVGNGIFANLMITANNEGFDQNIALIPDQLMLQKAGLGGSFTGQTSNLDYASYVHFNAVPEPSSLALLAAGSLAITYFAGRSRGRRAA